LGEFVIMPNHFHGILRIVGNCKANPTDQEIDRQVANRQKGDRQVAPTGPKTKSVGAVMAGFKSAVTKRINTMRDTPGAPDGNAIISNTSPATIPITIKSPNTSSPTPEDGKRTD
jgi:hypothetical protein